MKKGPRKNLRPFLTGYSRETWVNRPLAKLIQVYTASPIVSTQKGVPELYSGVFALTLGANNSESIFVKRGKIPSIKKAPLRGFLFEVSRRRDSNPHEHKRLNSLASGRVYHFRHAGNFERVKDGLGGG